MSSKKKRKTYRVYAKCLVPHEGYVEVEAYTEEEALEEAEGAEFDWESMHDIAYFELGEAEVVAAEVAA